MPDQHMRDPGNRTLTGPVGGCHVKIDAASEIKDPFDRRRNAGSEFDANHGCDITFCVPFTIQAVRDTNMLTVCSRFRQSIVRTENK